jgi:hypothetical protein
MPGMGFEPTIPVFERAKAVHALGHCYRQGFGVMDNYILIAYFFPTCILTDSGTTGFRVTFRHVSSETF